MRVGLFVPCYIEQFFPKVAIATLRLLERFGCTVDYPLRQTCCGQPMANSGCEQEAIPVMRRFVQNFASYDSVVAPSGSCVLHVREHFDRLEQTPEVRHVRENTYELCQFLAQVLRIDRVDASFPYRVGLHASCHGLRGLRLGRSSELVESPFDLVRRYLEQVRDIELVDLARPDECCGFGGTFAVTEAALSVRMGEDRLRDHVDHGAQVIAGTDVSCLMHLDGIIRRNRLPVRVAHVAEILMGV